ncbi:hypothetical protein ACFLR2_02530, partial [Chlamydiota bacterium]
DIVIQVEKIKKLIEDNLQTNLFMALGQGIQLGKACEENRGWVKKLAEKAETLAAGLGEEDRADLQPILEDWLGR